MGPNRSPVETTGKWNHTLFRHISRLFLSSVFRSFLVFLRSDRTWVLWTERATLLRDVLHIAFVCGWTFILTQRFLKSLAGWESVDLSVIVVIFPMMEENTKLLDTLSSRPLCIFSAWDISQGSLLTESWTNIIKQLLNSV